MLSNKIADAERAGVLVVQGCFIPTQLEDDSLRAPQSSSTEPAGSSIHAAVLRQYLGAAEEESGAYRRVQNNKLLAVRTALLYYPALMSARGREAGIHARGVVEIGCT